MDLETQIHGAENVSIEVSPATSNLTSSDGATETFTTGSGEGQSTFIGSSSGKVISLVLIAIADIAQESTWFDQPLSALSRITRISKHHQTLQKRGPMLHSHISTMQGLFYPHKNWQTISKTPSLAAIKFSIRF